MYPYDAEWLLFFTEHLCVLRSMHIMPQMETDPLHEFEMVQLSGIFHTGPETTT